MPYNPQKVLVSSKIRPQDPERAETVSVQLPAGVNYSAGQVLEEVTGAAQTEVQTVTVTGGPTGGSFTLGYPSLSGGFDVTAAIAYNATALTVQAALEAVVGTGNVTVAGGAGGPWTLTYANELALMDVAQPVLITNGLTGGATPSVAMATTTAGRNGCFYQAYAGGNARLVLESTTRTDLGGRIVDEFGSGTTLTAIAYSRGTFLGTDLIGVDATAVPSSGTNGPLGKLIQGATFASSNAVIRVGG
jgi:hypothetical protein